MFRRLAWVRRSGVPCQADDCAANTRTAGVIGTLKQPISEERGRRTAGFSPAQREATDDRILLLTRLADVRDQMRSWHQPSQFKNITRAAELGTAQSSLSPH